jgi:hypothetical protein
VSRARCRNALYLELHHLMPRSEGGTNVDENLVTLCDVHPRTARAGELIIEANPRAAFAFSVLMAPLSVARSTAPGAYTEVFSALHNVGLREAEARGVLNELRRHPDARRLGVTARRPRTARRAPSQVLLTAAHTARLGRISSNPSLLATDDTPGCPTSGCSPLDLVQGCVSEGANGPNRPSKR